MTLPATLADAARRELALWEKDGPAHVTASRIAQAELDRNIAAWRALATMFDTGTAQSDLEWEALEQIVAASLARRALDFEKEPGSQAKLDRYVRLFRLDRALADQRRLRAGIAAFNAHRASARQEQAA